MKMHTTKVSPIADLLSGGAMNERENLEDWRAKAELASLE